MAKRSRTWRPTLHWFSERARAHIRRIRREGPRSVASADAGRAAAFVRRMRWRALNDSRPDAVPVFIVGIQRSGTDMLIAAFKECPEVEVHNEAADSRAFSGWALRSDDVVRTLVERSRHRVVLFKSLLDTHRLDHLLAGLGTPSPGRAIWIYRTMEGRVRSTVARWPENNRRVLREIASSGAATRWEAGGLSDGQLELVRSFDYDELSVESAAALLWYLRNSLFFELGFDRRDDVALVSYERILEDPSNHLRRLCDFLGVTYTARMMKDIEPRPPAIARDLELDPRIRCLCDDLYARLEDECDRRAGRAVPVRT